MKCMNCAHYNICKKLNNTGFFEDFPNIVDCILYKSKHEEKVKDGEKKYNQQWQPRYKLFLQIEGIRCLN